MHLLALISLTCWLCALIATPRKPLPGDEVQELVYRRLVGRHHMLVALAAAATFVACCGALIYTFARATAP
jgi:hypothetical protein